MQLVSENPGDRMFCEKTNNTLRGTTLLFLLYPDAHVHPSQFSPRSSVAVYCKTS
jgi:hypothetical protein